MPTYRNVYEEIIENVRGNLRPDDQDWPSNNPLTGSFLLESGDLFLLETGDELLLE